MDNAIEFKTHSEIRDITMPRVVGNNQYQRRFIMAIDGGYSSVKGLSENRLFCFPSYAKKISEIEIIGRLGATDIILKNNRTKETWLVGGFAENTMDSKDVQATTDENLYTRYRYKSDIFRTIMMAGLGLSLWNTSLENLSLCLQTGLPSAYVQTDAAILKKVLADDYDFTLRVGDQTKNFRFHLAQDSIGVMEQPRGTMASVVYDRNGRPLPGMRDILNSNTIILDIGFGTEDIFSIRSGASIKDARNKTYSDTAMRSVFEAVANEINDQYHTAFKVFELQRYLEAGSVPVINMEEFPPVSTEVPIAGLLTAQNKLFCEKSIRRLLEEYNGLRDYQNLIVSGGTGESRLNIIQDMLKGLRLRVLPGNAADTSLSCIYSNARGYYMSMLLKVQKLTA